MAEEALLSHRRRWFSIDGHGLSDRLTPATVALCELHSALAWCEIRLLIYDSWRTADSRQEVLAAWVVAVEKTRAVATAGHLPYWSDGFVISLSHLGALVYKVRDTLEVCI